LPIHQPAPFVPRTTPIIPANPHAIAIYDNYPVSPGHCLIIPKWHIASFFDATREEQASLLDLLAEMRQLQLNPSQPPFNKVGSLSVSDGFNIGINGGRADDHALAHL